MSRLHSSLLIAIVSLLVLAGYAGRVLGESCPHAQHGHAEHQEKIPGGADDCQCLCHALVPGVAIEPVRALCPLVAVADFEQLADEIPPDALPLGIDHPPQLA